MRSFYPPFENPVQQQNKRVMAEQESYGFIGL